VTHRPVIDLPAGPVIRASDGRQVGMAARFGGELAGGSVADGTYCVWLIDRGDARALVWPPGYRARLDPLEILNPRRRGSSAGRGHAGRRRRRCPGGPITAMQPGPAIRLLHPGHRLDAYPAAQPRKAAPIS